jgi:taurine dioxygenase
MSEPQIRPVSEALGAEIDGVDLTNLSDAEFARIRAAYHEHGVIFFHGQELSPEQHISFAERWGEINVNRFFTPVDGYPRIALVLKEPEQKANIGGGWHTDHSYDDEPAMGSILLAREVPPTGGDTLFASMGAAYDALSDGFKETLETLKAVHSSRHIFGTESKYADSMKDRFGNQEQATQDVAHPVVIRHPDTGRKLLYVNPGFTIGIEGWDPDESKALLHFLYAHAAKPEFHYRFSWKKGSIAFWDNRATWHYALNDYDGERRMMHRITVEGVPLS